VIPGLDGRFLHNHLTDIDSVTGTSLGSMPAIRQYKDHPCCINTHEITIYSGGGGRGKAKRGWW